MKKKTLLITIPAILLLGFVGIYFLFPGVVFDFFLKMERNSGGLSQHGIDVDGIHYEYLEGGRGDVLVLIHGFGGNKDNWTRIGKHLTPHFRVIAPDLPGFGESTRDPDGDYTIGAQVERVRAFVRALGIESFHIGGNSMGGNISGAYAMRYPQDLKSLWLLDPGGVAAAEPSEMHQRMKAGQANPLVAENVAEYQNLLDFVFVKRPYIPGPILQHLVREAIAYRPLNEKIFKQLRSDSANPPLEVMLDGMPVRTLVVWGTRDRVLHPSGAAILTSVLPNGEAVLLDDVGHLPMVEKPEETARLYIEFLKKTG